MKGELPTYVLINPASRSGYSVKVWKALEPLFTKAGVEPVVLYSKKEEGTGLPMGSLAASLPNDGKEKNLIVLGGDGTLGEVLGGIQDFSLVNIGYIPTGSSNDFALGIGQETPEKAVKAILEHESLTYRDLGVATYIDPADGQQKWRYFQDAAGMGFDAAACWGANDSRFKKFLNRIGLGKLSYLAAAAKLVFTSPHNPMRVTTVFREGGEEVLDLQKGFFCVVMNHPYEGGGFRFCPQADGSDGCLDLCAVDDISPLRFFALFSTAYKGNHVGHRGITIRQGASFVIQSEEPLFFHTDGEVTGKTTCLRLHLEPGKLRFWN